MSASRQSLEKIKELAEKRHHDSDAKRKWDKLVLTYDQQNSTQTPPDPKGPELQALIEKLALSLDAGGKKHHEEPDDCCGRGAGDDDDGPNGAGIDLDHLAELVFERLIFEVRIERERVGRSA